MGTVILPGVVLCELYAGAASPLDAKDLQQIRAAFGPRILRTEIRDWTLAGQCISAYSRLWGKISPGNHIPDILVAISAIRASAVLGTHNAKDMLRWGRILEQFGKKLKIEKIPD
jgi:predicted nucleic acid-binding protein